MSILTTIISVLTGKKTIVKFSSGGYDIRLAFLGDVKNAPADFDRDLMNAALKDAMKDALTRVIAADKKRRN